MSPRIDWEHWRRHYVTGEDAITLDLLASMQNAPSLNTLKQRSRKESWVEQRKSYRAQVNTKVHQASTAQQVFAQTQKLVDAAEIITRHLQMARAMRGIAAKRLATIDPNELQPRDLVAWVKAATDIERLAMGLATEKTELDLNIDLSQLPDDQLERIAQGEAPQYVLN